MPGAVQGGQRAFLGELARRLGTSPLTLRRWTRHGVQPSAHYLLALQDLAEELGLAHLLPRARAWHRE